MDQLRDPELDALTAEMAWLGRLARALVRDPSTADDIAQETWLAAAGRVPDDRPLRPWLSRVMLNVVRMRGRGDRRREAREAAVPESEARSTTDELVDRAMLQRSLVDAVLALAEPYRATVLLHFFEELSSAEIARRLGVPDGTVRRRLKVALDELRARLDTRPRRGNAFAALLAFSTPRFAMKKLALAVLILIVVGLAVWRLKLHSSDEVAPVAGGDPKAVATGGASPRAAGDKIEHLAWFVQPGAPARRIAGHVMFDGKPFAGATVRLANIIGDDPQRGPRGGDEITAVLSTADGAFDFGPQPASFVAVSAEANGKQPAATVVALADPKAKPDQITLTLAECRTRVFGNVVDSSGGGIPKARLRVTGLAGTSSDDTGAYSLCMPLDSVLHVEADGYGALDLPFHLVGELRRDFELVPEAVLAGRVVDEGGRPQPLARVVAAPQTFEQPHFLAAGSTTADADGKFRIAKLAPGHYLVAATAEGMSSKAPQPAAATTGAGARDLVLVVTKHMRIAGRVMASGKPVAGACVTVVSAAPKLGARCGYSQDDGRFVLDGVAPGKIKLDAPPFKVGAPKILAVDRNLDDVVVEVSSLASLHGSTLRHGKPVAEVVVQTFTGLLATSDASGHYELLGLPAGKLQLVAQVSGDVNAFMPVKTVTMGEGETTELDLELSGAAEVHGTVVDDGGKPVPNVYVRLVDAANADLGESMSDAGGAFHCTSMTGGGPYRVSVYPSPGARTAFVLAPSNSTETFDLPNGDTILRGVRIAIVHDVLAISGRVIDDTGAPVADVHVEAIGRIAPGPVNGGAMIPSIRADSDGHFAIPNLAPGAYTIHAHGGDGSEAEVPNIPAGTTTAEIKVIRPGTVTGKLVGFTGTPRVHARLVTNQLFLGNEAVVDGDQFTITGLTPGKYVVEALLGDEHDGKSVQIEAGKTATLVLESKGAGSVDGTVVEWGTKKPLAGMNCLATQSIGGQAGDFGQGAGGPGQAESSATGTFHITAPVGKARVLCFSPDGTYSVAGADVEVAATAPAKLELAAVKAVPPPSDPGFLIKSLTLPLVVAIVDPGGPAKGLAVGDRVVSLDGQSVAGLIPSGAMMVAWNHRPGTTLVVGIERAGTPLTIQIVVGKQRS